jgi:circadian clock protein KaiC
VRKKMIVVDYVRVERSEIEENGEYDLAGLFIRLDHAIKSIGAKRVMLDTIETLFAGLDNQAILRAELRRLFGWLKDKGMTTVITGERGDGALTRQGLEEYVSDCVILLDHRVSGQISTRRLRIVKYRGSTHGTNEYPFLIDAAGISVLPITSLSLSHSVSSERVPTGIPRLDTMLGGKGYFKGSSILASGTAGSGKSSLAAHLANHTCALGKRVAYFAFEESKAQIIRNMRSVGLNLGQWEDKKLLHFFNSRPSAFGLETHLAMIHKRIMEVKPAVVVMDPITNLLTAAPSIDEVTAMLTRLIDYLKAQSITAFFTCLVSGNGAREGTEMGISSLMDTWILLRDIELNGERNRAIYVLKSRGMAHSNQVREFLMTNKGIDLRDIYVGPQGVLTGSSRLAQELLEKGEATLRDRTNVARRRELERKRKAIGAQIEALQAEVAIEEEELRQLADVERLRSADQLAARRAMGHSRHADIEKSSGTGSE